MDLIKRIKVMIQNQHKINVLEEKIADLEGKLFEKESIITSHEKEKQELKIIYETNRIRIETIYKNKLNRVGSLIKLAKMLEKRMKFNIKLTDLPVSSDLECYLKILNHLKGEQ